MSVHRGGEPGGEADVLVLGGAGIDTIVRVPSVPLPVKDAISVPPIYDYVGHTGAAVAFACHTLGLRTELVDVVGDDDPGRLVRRRFDHAGIPYTFVQHPSGTRRSVNLVGADGVRLALYDGRHPADTFVDPALYHAAIGRARHVHVSIMSWARHAFVVARQAGRETSTDLHDWDGEADYHRTFAEQADIVFMSTAALGDRVDEVAGRILERGRARVVVALAGADGCRFTVPGSGTRAIPAVELPDMPVVDTNGAGDAFVAAFLYAHLAGLPWDRAAEAGVVAGAFACGSPGTADAFIDAERLRSELRERTGQPS
jgi:sugar/nucleoside kinase (ribokinase family)